MEALFFAIGPAAGVHASASEDQQLPCRRANVGGQLSESVSRLSAVLVHGRKGEDQLDRILQSMILVKSGNIAPLYSS